MGLGTPTGCYDHGQKQYMLDVVANGSAFFDVFDFIAGLGSTHGAEQYVSRDDALNKSLAQAYESHAIIKVGNKDWMYKRQSVKVQTKKSWTYFLAAMHFTHTPYGCSTWPGFWMMSTAAGVQWPNGGELDIMEYANDVAAGSSMHVGDQDKCQLNSTLLNKPSCPQFHDFDSPNYDCVTSYFGSSRKLGCAPNSVIKPGVVWSGQPGVIAAEWTESYVKVFFIPEASIPLDLVADEPKPDTWDQWVISYFPLASSEKLNPGSCPSPEKVLTQQALVLNIALCGDWAGGEWTPNCEAMTSNCKAGDIWHPADDCCTRFIWNSTNDDYFAQNAYFNISWLKVYQDKKAIDELTMV